MLLPVVGTDAIVAAMLSRLQWLCRRPSTISWIKTPATAFVMASWWCWSGLRLERYGEECGLLRGEGMGRVI